MIATPLRLSGLWRLRNEAARDERGENAVGRGDPRKMIGQRNAHGLGIGDIGQQAE